MSDSKGYLEHKDYKYIDKYKGKSGKWIYVYNPNKLKTYSNDGVTKVSYGKGEGENFTGIQAQHVKNDKFNNTSVTKYNADGSNKGKFDVSKKIGNGMINIYGTRDEYETSLGVRVDKAAVEKYIDIGRKYVEKFLKTH